MKTYIKPLMECEVFTTNEYVSACYTLACQAGTISNPPYGYRWRQGEYGGVTHSPLGTSGTCADANVNRIITDNNGVIMDIDEHNNEQGWISGGLDQWIDVNNNDICDNGDVIYWHTYSSNKDRRWNHWGYVSSYGNANHS